MLALLTLMACQEKMEDQWVGTCTVESHALDVELKFDDQAWDILSGELTISEIGASSTADFEGARSGEDVELEFLFDADNYEWQGRWLGKVDGNDMDATLSFVGSEYATDGECVMEED